MVHLHRRRETAALVHIERHQDLIALPYFGCLFLVRKQHILLESPVEKGSDLRHLGHFQFPHLTYAQKRPVCRSDDPVPGILVQKHLDRIPHPAALRHLFFRKEHSVIHGRIGLLTQIHPEIQLLHNDQRLCFSQFKHILLSSIFRHPPHTLSSCPACGISVSAP